MSYYDELVEQYDRQRDELAQAYADYKANPTPEGYRRCQLLGYSVADTEWEMRRNYPKQYGSEHVEACKERQEARYRLINY